MQHRKWRFTLKQRMGLCLAAFFAAFAMQLALNGYQSRAVQAVQDAQMGSFNAISRFQGGVESSISVLENYRWENSETDELMERLQSASSTCNAWLWRIGTSLEELENVSDEQRVLYGAVDTVYQTYTGLLEELQSDLRSGDDAAASQLYYAKILPCGDYLSQYTLQLLETAILDAQGSYTVISALNERIVLLQTVVVALCVALGCVSGLMVMRLLTPVQQMIAASRAIGRSKFDIPDIPLPKQPEIAQLAESFNIMKHSMAQQVTTLQEKNEIERELHRQKTEALELQNRMERSRLQQLRSQIDPHFLFNTLNVIQQTAGTETAYRTQALIMALSHLLRYSLMSNDEQVPLSREVRIVDEYYSIYHVRFGERVRMEWRFSDLLDLTETMVPSFILQPVVENAFKHGICPKEEGGVVRIRVNPLRTTDEALTQTLQQEGHTVTAGPWPHCLLVMFNGNPAASKAFHAGQFHVQGLASQFAALCCDARPGMRVLDLCAAPGGKSLTIAEQMQNRGELLSGEAMTGRVKLLKQAFDRCGIERAKPYHGDATILNPAFGLGSFDRVLCDVPCSGLGVIGKKPDIREKTLDGIENLLLTQQKILQNGAKYLAPNGRLVYSTCTVNHHENEAQVRQFLQDNQDFSVIAPQIILSGMRVGEYGTLFLPHETSTDGFFAAILERQKNC